MSSSVSDYLATDDLTILLAFISATVFLLGSFYRPQPLVHPILLGRQSDVARVRNPGESAVYRNYGTGLMGRFPLRPHKDVHILPDFVRTESDATRTLWDTKISNPRLQDRIVAFGTGLLRLANVHAQESNVLLLLNDSIEFIIADLALATHSIPSLTLASSTLLSAVLESHPPSAIITHAAMLPSLLEVIYDGGETNKNHTIIVVGEPSLQVMATVSSKVTILKWDDVEREGIKTEKILSPVPKSSDVFTVSFFQNESGHLQGVQLTHENITAGVAATRALVPISQGLSSIDTILTAFPLSTAFGRSIAYTAIFEGTCLASTDSTSLYPATSSESDQSPDDILNDVLAPLKKYKIPSPTILFLRPTQIMVVQKKILESAKKNWLYKVGWKQKIAAIAEGFISKDSLWDRLLFDAARAEVIGEMAGTVRSVVVSGGPIPENVLTAVRVAFSTPFVNTYTHPLVPGPILASHPLDLQDFYSPSSETVGTAAVGPPSINIEAKLVGVLDEQLEKDPTLDPEGALVIRGPSVGKLLAGPMEASYVNIPSESARVGDDEGWMGTGVRARVRTNGVFKIFQ